MSNVQENNKVVLPAAAENIAFWIAKVEETKLFLQRNPDVRLSAGARELLSEYEEKLERAKYDAEHPAPPPPPAPTPELIKLVSDTITAMLPQFVAQVVMEVQSKRF